MSPVVSLIIISVISYTAIGICLFLSVKYVKKDSAKNLIFVISSLLTLFIHYTGLVYDYLTYEDYVIEDNMFLPVYPCNVVMWMNVVLAVFIKRRGKVFSLLSDFSFVGGTLCGIIGLSFNINFYNNPNLLDYDIFRGLLSHVTMIFSCIYLYFMGCAKIDTLRNSLSFLFGGAIFYICGIYTRIMLKLLNRSYVNTMYIDAPYEKMPFFNFYTMFLTGFVIMFILSTVYEIKTRRKEDVWFNRIRNKRKEEKQL